MFFSLKEVCSGYDHVPVIRDTNLELPQGKINIILGRNGVGKTTLMKTIIGILPCTSGNIIFQNNDITKLTASSRAQIGIGYVPQGRGIFPRLTVEENLQMGELINNKNSNKLFDQVYNYFPRLAERKKQNGGTLSGGEQQMLAIGRAIVGNPELLILDEPSEGVQPNIVKEIGEVLVVLNKERGFTILLVEQNIDFAMGIANDCFIMDKGTIVAQLSKNDLMKEDIMKKYLAI